VVWRLELNCLRLVRRVCQVWPKQTLGHQQGCLHLSPEQQQLYQKLRQKSLLKLCVFGPEG